MVNVWVLCIAHDDFIARLESECAHDAGHDRPTSSTIVSMLHFSVVLRPHRLDCALFGIIYVLILLVKPEHVAEVINSEQN